MKRKVKKRNQNKIVYAFIDSQNLNLGILDQGWKLDFAKFRIYLKDKYRVKKVFLFIGYVGGNKKLYKFLKKAGFELIFKPTMMDYKGKVKGNVDAELVLHCAKIEYDNYDKAIIVSGDGDFYCLLKFLRDERKLFKLIVPNIKAYSILLREFHKFTLFMNNQKSKLEYKGE